MIPPTHVSQLTGDSHPTVVRQFYGVSPDSRPTVGEVTISSFFHLEHFVPEVAGGPGKGFVSYIFVYFKPPSWYGHHLQANTVPLKKFATVGGTTAARK